MANLAQQIPRTGRTKFNRLWERLQISGTISPQGAAHQWFLLPLRIYETWSEIFVEADMCGVESRDVSVTLENKVLTIQAEKTEKEMGTDDRLCPRDDHWVFSRSIQLPCEVREDFRTTLENGVLKVKLFKIELKFRESPIDYLHAPGANGFAVAS